MEWIKQWIEFFRSQAEGFKDWAPLASILVACFSASLTTLGIYISYRWGSFQKQMMQEDRDYRDKRERKQAIDDFVRRFREKASRKTISLALLVREGIIEFCSKDILEIIYRLGDRGLTVFPAYFDNIEEIDFQRFFIALTQPTTKSEVWYLDKEFMEFIEEFKQSEEKKDTDT